MDNSDIDILDILAEDRELITYRKSLNHITGSVLATILLQQILYWSKKGGWEPFYKFRMPCSHHLYKAGYSWSEELGFTPYEFDTALDQIGTKITKGIKKSDTFKKFSPKAIVIYWTDASRVTWYQVNRQLLGNLIKCNYLVNGFCPITLESDKVQLPLTETPTKTPSEIIESPTGDNAPPSNSNNHNGDNSPSPNGQQVMDEAFPREPGYNPPRSRQPLTQMDVLIGPRTPIPEPQDRQKIEMVERDIANSGWDIHSAAIRHIAVYFFTYTPFDIPQSDSTRKGWLKEFKTHKDDFGLIAIPDLYKRATTELFDPDRMDEKGYRPPTGPWGYTKTMHGLKAVERVGLPDTTTPTLQEEYEPDSPFDEQGNLIDIFNPPKGYRL